MAYANRTDLNNPGKKVAMATAKGQTYGAATAQMESQRAVPMGQAPTEMQAAQQSYAAPGANGAFDRPSERPNEPLTAGVNFGEGPNQMQSGIMPPARVDDPIVERLRALYQQFPNEDLADLLDSYVNDGQ